MIDEKFWQNIADNWCKDDDGISIPEVKTGGVELIDPTIAKEDLALDDEIDDILSDLGLDDDF